MKKILKTANRTSKIMQATYRNQTTKHGNVTHPQIRISGAWLQKYGFEYGTTFLVDVEKNRIIITKLDNE